ncbi:hypothetical protein B0H13DRAFT_2314485 [Mycena leptocephala]|nr:hypothetical protein B0H13DRAFT_2314485 [Mycena leptocephala]
MTRPGIEPVATGEQSTDPDPTPPLAARILTLVGAADDAGAVPTHYASHRLFVGNIAFDATEADVGPPSRHQLVYVTFTAPDGAEQLLGCPTGNLEPNLRAFWSVCITTRPSGLAHLEFYRRRVKRSAEPLGFSIEICVGRGQMSRPKPPTDQLF